MAFLKEKYNKEVVSKMMEMFGYKNKMAVPKITSVVVNVGFGKQITDKTKEEREKIQNHILEILTAITGQKPSLRKARKSIAGFKLREGLPIGAVVTLRRQRMNDFLERLISLSLPRARDFKGIDKKSIDNSGNLTIGFKDVSSFPEVKFEKEKEAFSLEATIKTTAKNKDEGIQLFKLLGFPMKM